MGILFKAVNLSNDTKKQMIIQDLINLGVTEYKGKDIYALDYYEAKHVLAVERLKRDQ